MTAQVCEHLILDGEETAMAFCPPLPEGNPRLVEVAVGEDAELDDVTKLTLFSTACWRGYVGTWEIKDGRFYLVALRGRFELRGEGPLLADWFSRVPRIPMGARLQYVHMGFGSVHEKEVHVKVEHGVVVATREFDEHELTRRNLPGGENRFPGDDEIQDPTRAPGVFPVHWADVERQPTTTASL